MSMFDQTPGMGMGFNYGGIPQNQQKIMNNLTAEEIQKLQQQHSQFSLGLTERESLQAACNHRVPDGSDDSLVYDKETGIVRCTICGYEFRPIEPDESYESIKDASDRIIDILQTIKMMYTDLPPQAAREYFQIIPLIAKVPQLFEFAAKNFAKHEFNNWSYNHPNMGGMALLANLNNMFGATNMYQQPQMGAPMGAPGMVPPPQPMGMQAGFPQAAYGQNPFYGTPAPTPGYAPQANGFAYNPAAQPAPQVAPTVAAPQAPAAEAAPAAETVTQTVTV